MNSGTQVIIQSWFTYFIKQCQDRVSGLVLVLVFRFHTLSFLHNLRDLLSKFSFLNCKWKDIKSKRYCHSPFHATRRIRPRTCFVCTTAFWRFRKLSVTWSLWCLMIVNQDRMKGTHHYSSYKSIPPWQVVWLKMEW